MSTRGFFGFVVNGDLKVTYNHFDSYPSGLGAAVLDWLRKTDHNFALMRAANLVLVEEGDQPTPDQVKALKQYADPSVGNNGIHNTEVHDWYQLLRNTQGDPEATLSAGFMIDSHQFPLDSLFCEWGYLVNFDTDEFEVYRGFQNSPPTAGYWIDGPGRPAHGGTSYYPVNLVATYRLSDLPDSDDFVKYLDGDDEED